MTKGILLVAFDLTNAHEDEFHDWYDLEHIPERLRVPGFLNAERWIAEDVTALLGRQNGLPVQPERVAAMDVRGFSERQALVKLAEGL